LALVAVGIGDWLRFPLLLFGPFFDTTSFFSFLRDRSTTEQVWSPAIAFQGSFRQGLPSCHQACPFSSFLFSPVFLLRLAFIIRPATGETLRLPPISLQDRPLRHLYTGRFLWCQFFSSPAPSFLALSFSLAVFPPPRARQQSISRRSLVVPAVPMLIPFVPLVTGHPLTTSDITGSLHTHTQVFAVKASFFLSVWAVIFIFFVFFYLTIVPVVRCSFCWLLFVL